MISAIDCPLAQDALKGEKVMVAACGPTAAQSQIENLHSALKNSARRPDTPF